MELFAYWSHLIHTSTHPEVVFFFVCVVLWPKHLISEATIRQHDFLLGPSVWNMMLKSCNEKILYVIHLVPTIQTGLFFKYTFSCFFKFLLPTRHVDADGHLPLALSARVEWIRILQFWIEFCPPKWQEQGTAPSTCVDRPFDVIVSHLTSPHLCPCVSLCLLCFFVFCPFFFSFVHLAVIYDLTWTENQSYSIDFFGRKFFDFGFGNATGYYDIIDRPLPDHVQTGSLSSDDGA